MKVINWFKKILFFSVFTLMIIACDESDEFEVVQNATVENENSSGNTEGSGNIVDNNTNQQGQNGEITRYTVSENGEISHDINYSVSGEDLAYQKDTAKHSEIWDLVKKIVPESHMKRINQYMIFNGESQGTLGYVFQTQDNLTTWQMGLSIPNAYVNGVLNGDGDLAYTIIHEFGHILSLNETQIDPTQSESSCQEFHTGQEGCAKGSSYVNKLYDNFWADIWEEYQSSMNSQAQLEAFYNKYKDRFLTRYSVTNPIEDLAEVFATFVVRDGGPINDGSIKEKKIQMMYDHSELVELRSFIRANNVISSEISLSRMKNRNVLILPMEGKWSKSNTIGDPNQNHRH